jgi:hypothetical protein
MTGILSLMRTLKVIAGLGCLAAAIPLGMFAWGSFFLGELWIVKLVPSAFTLGLVSIGLFLISRRSSVLSARTKVMIAIFFSVLIATPALLDIFIRHERKVLQTRAKEFLSRPIPKLLIPDSEGNIGGYFVDTNAGPQNGVFGYSLILIGRYATNGRIRWSARIQGQFATTAAGINPNIRSDAIDTNEEVRLYLAERNAILAKEWRMGFWQWVEDTIEMKDKIPEYEEEDYHPTPATNDVSR